MRRILDGLSWVFVVTAIVAAFYFSGARTDSTSEFADHRHVSERQRAACQRCRNDVMIQEVYAAGSERAVRSF